MTFTPRPRRRNEARSRSRCGWPHRCRERFRTAGRRRPRARAGGYRRRRGGCSFWKMLVTCFSTPRSVRNTRAAIAEFDSPSAISSSTSRSRALSSPIGSSRRRRPTSCETTLGSSAEPPLGDPLDRGDEVGEVVDPVLQQVADAFGAFLQQLERVALLDVLGEDEHRRVRVLLADLLRRAQSFVGLGRRHLDVDDRDVGLVRADLQQQILGRAALADDLESLALEQAGDALAQQHGVVGEDDADRRLVVLQIGVLDVDATECRRPRRDAPTAGA